jgi:biopolymer transport protein ExbD
MDFQRERRRRPMLVLTPLIDIVFLLLVFFLLTGTFAPSDPFSVRPPVSSSEAPQVFREHVVFVGATGEIALDDRSVSLFELERALRDALESDPMTSVTIKADALVPSVLILSLLSVTESAGATGARLVTVPEAIEPSSSIP